MLLTASSGALIPLIAFTFAPSKSSRISSPPQWDRLGGLSLNQAPNLRHPWRLNHLFRQLTSFRILQTQPKYRPIPASETSPGPIPASEASPGPSPPSEASPASGPRPPTPRAKLDPMPARKPLNARIVSDHGIWLARHGYEAFVLDTVEFGEAPGIHHGTHDLGMWYWHSLGYTPAGPEV